MINLLTNKQKRIVHSTRLLRVWILIVFGTISLISISLILFFPTFLAINTKYSEAKESEKKIQTSFSVTPETVTALSKKITEVSSLFAAPETASTLGYLDIIEEKSMGGITISRITNDSRSKKTITIGGLASTRSTLAQYEARLRNDIRIEQVESPVSNYVKMQNTAFVLTIIFK